jgi:hypothetical protein
VTAVTEALQKQGNGKPYSDVKTTLLTDGQATLSNLTFALRQLKDTATENDVALIFLAGHGVIKDGVFYFASCEVNRADIPGTALDWRQFIATLRDVRAKRVLVLADTCQSGGIVGEKPMDNDELARKLNREAHRLVFTAATRDECSIERAEWGHGAFTKALLEALAGKADTRHDGQLTFQQLRDYVPARVAELTDGRQHPQLPFLDQFEPDAVFARTGESTAPTPSAPPPPATFPAAKVHLTTTPPGATVLLDGVQQAQLTPCTLEIPFIADTPRKVVIQLRLDGYHTSSGTGTFKSGEDKNVAVTLQRLE